MKTCYERIKELEKELNLAYDDINYLLMEKNRYLRALQELTRTDYGRVSTIEKRKCSSLDSVSRPVN